MHYCMNILPISKTFSTSNETEPLSGIIFGALIFLLVYIMFVYLILALRNA